MSTLTTVHAENALCKFADDGYLIVPASANDTIAEEIDNIISWASTSNLKLNMSKTHEIIFCNKTCNTNNLPPPIPNIKRVSSLTVLGITVDADLSFKSHILDLTSRCSQKLYALKILKNHGIQQSALFNICKATLISVLIYASPAWWGFLLATQISQLNSIINKAKKWGFLEKEFLPFEALCKMYDSRLFHKILNNPRHVLHHLLPPPRTLPYNLRTRAHNRAIPSKISNLQRKTFIYKMLLTDLY
jgi:hypothetical protein